MRSRTLLKLIEVIMTMKIYFEDLDGDGYGTLPGIVSCQSLGSGFVNLSDDCDDAELRWG